MRSYVTISLSPCVFFNQLFWFSLFALFYCFSVCSLPTTTTVSRSCKFFSSSPWLSCVWVISKYIFCALVSFSLLLFFLHVKIYFCESFNAKWVLRTLYHLYVYLCMSVNMNQSHFHKKRIENDPDDKTRQEQAQNVSKWYRTKRLDTHGEGKTLCGC